MIRVAWCVAWGKAARGVFTSVPELEQAIDDYIEHNNANPKPFAWTKSANDIIFKVIVAEPF